MTLYKINEALNRLLALPDGEAVDTETGEVFSPEAIRELEIALEDKLEGCGVFCKNCDVEIAGRKAEIEVQKKEIARLERQKERAINLVKLFGGLNENNTTFKTTKVTWKWKLNPAHVEIQEGLTADDFPQYQRIKKELDKTALKNALKAGEQVDGAWLQQDESISYK